jgi:hypothetical protein
MRVVDLSSAIVRACTVSQSPVIGATNADSL